MAGAASGTWDVQVTNPDGQRGTLYGGFTVRLPPAPRVDSVAPDSGTNDGVVHIVVEGAHFYDGAQVKLIQAGQNGEKKAGCRIGPGRP